MYKNTLFIVKSFKGTYEFKKITKARALLPHSR